MRRNKYTYRSLIFFWFLMTCSIGLHGQEISTSPTAGERALLSDCDRLIFLAREFYNKGDLVSIIDTLLPCAEETDLSLSQRRMLLRLLAESHLYTRDYPAASEYARLLTEIDPKLDVYGVSRLVTKEKKNLRAAIQSAQYVDAPDLLLLIGNIRYHSLSAEVFGGTGIDLYAIQTQRNAEGVSMASGSEWTDARRLSFGIGLKYDSYRLPVSLAIRLNRQSNSFNYTERQVIDGTPAQLTLHEKQQWISPELWIGYQFAPKNFPVKSLDFSLNGGAGLDVLTASSLEPANLIRQDGNSWYSGSSRSLKNEIDQKLYFSVFGSAALEYRFSRFSTFAEIQYRHPFLKKYVYDIPAAPYASDVRSIQHVGLRIGVRAIFYKAFYK